MFSVGKYRIMHESEVRKFEKLSRIFNHYSEPQLNDILSGKVHLHRNPKKNKCNSKYNVLRVLKEGS